MIEIVNQLRNIRNAVDKGKDAELAELISKLMDDVSKQIRRQEKLENLARTVRSNATSGTKPESVAVQFLKTSNETRLSKTTITATLMGYLKGEISRGDALEAIDGGIRLHSNLQNRTNELHSVKEGVDIPPILAVFSDEEVEIPKGSSKTVSITIQNLGNKKIENVSIDTETELTVNLETNTISSISPSQSKVVELDIEAQQTGEYTIGLSVVSDNAEGPIEILASIADKKKYLEIAIQQVQSIQNEVDNMKGPKNKLGVVEKKLKKLVKDIESDKGPIKANNNKIRSDINELEAFINQIEAKQNKKSNGNSENSLNASEVGRLRHDTNQIIVTLEMGIGASI